MVATTATSSAMTQMPTALRDALGLARDDMRNLEARVVSGERHVRAATEGEPELELHLPGAYVGHSGRIVQGGLHPVAISHRHHFDRGRNRWALVDNDLVRGSRERAQRRDPPSIDRDGLGALCKQQVGDVLYVLEVDEIAGLDALVRPWSPVDELDFDA